MPVVTIGVVAIAVVLSGMIAGVAPVGVTSCAVVRSCSCAVVVRSC